MVTFAIIAVAFLHHLNLYTVDGAERAGVPESTGVELAGSPTTRSGLDSTPAFEPVRGIWPGLGLTASVSDTLDDQEISVQQIRPRNHTVDEYSEADADESPVLLDRIEGFDRLPPERRATEAFAIAGAWSRCKQHYQVDDAALFELATRRYENALRRAEAALAESEDLAAVEADIQRIAQIDREELTKSIFDELKDLERECAGTVSLGFEEREARVFRWVARAAELGHHGARADYVYMAFQGRRVTSGKASLLIERKRRVARYVLEMLAKRNVRGLELLGHVVQRGCFQPPNPELAYAYNKAAVEIIQHDHSTVWQVFDGDDRNLPFLRGRVLDAAEQMDAVSIRRAESLARRILAISD